MVNKNPRKVNILYYKYTSIQETYIQETYIREYKKLVYLYSFNVADIIMIVNNVCFSIPVYKKPIYKKLIYKKLVYL